MRRGRRRPPTGRSPWSAAEELVLLSFRRPVFEGALRRAVEREPRVRVRPGVTVQALTAVHDHPSGVPRPSPEDVRFTEAMGRAGALLGVPVLDHLIVTRRAYFSFREAGLGGIHPSPAQV